MGGGLEESHTEHGLKPHSTRLWDGVLFGTRGLVLKVIEPPHIFFLRSSFIIRS
jgi:hypothetical protein